MGNPINAALASAQKTLDDSNNLTDSVNKQAGPPTAKPKPQPKSDYSHAHDVRKAAASGPTTGDELAAKKRQVEEVSPQ
jgi:hypothetical protein